MFFSFLATFWSFCTRRPFGPIFGPAPTTRHPAGRPPRLLHGIIGPRLLPQDDMALIIDIKLVGTGWAQCTVRPARKNFALTASYESNVLGDLIQAALTAWDGDDQISFEFHGARTGWTWNIEQKVTGRLSIQILELVYRPAIASLDRVPIVDFSCTVGALAQAVHDAAADVLTAHGLKGYEELWAEHLFPTKSFNRLKALVEAMA